MRKRTIAARVERLYNLTGYPRKYPKRGRIFCYRWTPNKHYILTHTLGLQMYLAGFGHLANVTAALEQHGWLWGDAHEYAHGLDVGKHASALSWSDAFHAALTRDKRPATRPQFSALTRHDRQEIFADAIAYTVVNDRGFIHEHPAKYAYARALLKEHGVI